MDANPDRICALANRFRTAMDSSDFSDTQWLSRFPKESCDITCKLLGLYFYDHGFRDFAIMRGNRPDEDDGKHQWLQFGDTIVDITADQFDGEDQLPVIVTIDSPWHVVLDGHLFKQFDHNYYHMLTDHDFAKFVRDIYSRILANIEP